MVGVRAGPVRRRLGPTESDCGVRVPRASLGPTAMESVWSRLKPRRAPSAVVRAAVVPPCRAGGWSCRAAAGRLLLFGRNDRVAHSTQRLVERNDHLPLLFFERLTLLHEAFQRLDGPFSSGLAHTPSPPEVAHGSSYFPHAGIRHHGHSLRRSVIRSHAGAIRHLERQASRSQEPVARDLTQVARIKRLREKGSGALGDAAESQLVIGGEDDDRRSGGRLP